MSISHCNPYRSAFDGNVQRISPAIIHLVWRCIVCKQQLHRLAPAVFPAAAASCDGNDAASPFLSGSAPRLSSASAAWRLPFRTASSSFGTPLCDSALGFCFSYSSFAASSASASCAQRSGVWPLVSVFKQRVCPRSKQVLHNGLLRRPVMQCCFGASLLKHRKLRSGKARSHVDCISPAYYRCCQSSRTSSSTQEYQLAEGSAWYSTERFCCSTLRHGFRFCAASAAFSTLCCR